MVIFSSWKVKVSRTVVSGDGVLGLNFEMAGYLTRFEDYYKVRIFEFFVKVGLDVCCKTLFVCKRCCLTALIMFVLC